MLETNVVCIVIALMFLYTFVGICAGFGGGLTTMPLVTLMLPVKMATPLSVIVGTATALYATWLSRKETDWRSAMVLIIFSFLGIPVGLYALSYLPDHFMKVGLGGFLILYSFYSMFIPRLPIYDRSWIAAPIGAVAGALGAAFSTNGPPMVIYGMLRNFRPGGVSRHSERFLHRKQHRGDRRAGDQRNFALSLSLNWCCFVFPP